MASYLQFAPFRSTIDLEFWLQLSKVKLEQLKLSSDPIPINTYYSLSSHTTLPPRLIFSYDSFQLSEKRKQFVNIQTQCFIFNKIEEFKAFDIQLKIDDQKFNQTAQIIVFPDLKKHVFTYWVAYQTPKLKQIPYTLLDISKVHSESFSSNLLQNLTKFQEQYMDFFTITQNGDIENLDFKGTIFGFIDPCPDQNKVGAPLKLFIYWLIKNGRSGQDVQIFCFKNSIQNLSNTVLIEIKVPDASILENLTITGWEIGNSNKPSPNQINLAPVLDQQKLAEHAVDLNIQLMRWRMAPSLPIPQIQQMKALLIGSGTLGCEISRKLMAWGWRNITFVDNGKISYSNPVRQSLYELSDVGQPKALVAAEKLKKIFPGINSQGVEMNIPMPGHPFANKKELEETVQKLDGLVQSHDVVFLLTDSRESRWLATLQSVVYDKLCFTVALGFETYVIFTHPNSQFANNSCYFCSDILGPRNSLKDRTLDEQCTVTRAGVSSIASALCVEILMSVIDPELSALYEEVQIPQQIRGSVRDFRQDVIGTGRTNLCTACSQKIVQKYKENNVQLVDQVCSSPQVLEEIVEVDKFIKKLDQLEEENLIIEWD